MKYRKTNPKVGLTDWQPATKVVKPTQVEVTKANKRGSFKSATSGLKDWEPKTGKPFRDTKRPGTGVQFPQPNKPYP